MNRPPLTCSVSVPDTPEPTDAQSNRGPRRGGVAPTARGPLVLVPRGPIIIGRYCKVKHITVRSRWPAPV
ncbi:hypothetical protein SAV14893_091460 [Streptomyces avermitilis]|uniref:Uncharacterized protein n=1 Tax=Streptomyces avermitilis TaxID=33903 RepID=A0A4D4N645_STRAX|nr:hypothetical protein SAVMC3_05020 [Streptomyces avermitilis]GDY69753.1 hypothetical protein SAV14893_091460 [Streptomyces avermitilis]GDY80012.1 hypothetical protein SAV31267_094970 [Streptomyces avermitilis]